MKTVDEQMEHRAVVRREPQLGCDTLTTVCDASKTASLFLSRMYYIYHFESDSDATPVSFPPQICPVNILSFSQFTSKRFVTLVDCLLVVKNKLILISLLF